MSPTSAEPAAPELGDCGVCQVRFGKAMRGSPPKRRSVATVMPWVPQALAQYLDEVRPLFRAAASGDVADRARGADRVAHVGRGPVRGVPGAAGSARELSVHCLRHFLSA